MADWTDTHLLGPKIDKAADTVIFVIVVCALFYLIAQLGRDWLWWFS